MNIIKTILFVTTGLFVLFLFSSVAFSNEALDGVSIDYKRFVGPARNPLFYNSVPKEEINLNLNTTLLDYVFWNNKIHSLTDEHQFYLVGWNFKLGIRVTEYLDVQYEHFSKHLLDDKYPYQGYPLENSVGFTLHLYKNNNRKETIIP